jgi:hypothetical protein
MTRSCSLAAALVAALMLGRAVPSRADPVVDGAQAHVAATHFERGVKLYEEQDWRAALIEFDRAYAVSPQYRVLYNIGQCDFQLADYAGARAAFEKYLADGGALVPDARREQVRASIEELGGRVALVRVVTDVDGAEVTVDDTVVGKTPLESPILVSAGRRKIGATKAGRTGAVRVVDLAGEDSVEIALNLGLTVSATAGPVVFVKPAPARWRWPTVTAFGIAAAGLAIGGVFGLEAIVDKRNLDRACVDKACPPSSQGQIDDSERNAALSTAGMAVGVASLGVGIAMLLLSPGGESVRSPSAPAVQPFVGLGFGGAVGRF